MNLYIFRHGETFETKHNLQYGERVEIAEILPEGIPIVKRLAEYLKNIKTDANYTSPYLRCIQTTEIVSDITGSPFTVDQRLSEYREDEESLTDLFERTKNFLTELDEAKLKNAAICTHGYLISTLTQFATKGKIDMKYLDTYPKPGVLTIIKRGKLEKIDFNS